MGLVIAQVLGELGPQARLQHPSGESGQDAVGADQVKGLVFGLGVQLFGHLPIRI